MADTSSWGSVEEWNAGDNHNCGEEFGGNNSKDLFYIIIICICVSVISVSDSTHMWLQATLLQLWELWYVWAYNSIVRV